MAAVKPRILIIDPDTATVQYLMQELKRIGYDVYTATGGKEGLIAAYRERPHISIIDPVFQDLPPGELMKKVRNDARTAQRTYIAFSSLQDPDQIQKSLQMGFDHYISKEADALPGLLRKIQEIVSQKDATLGTDTQKRPAETTRRATQPRPPQPPVEEKNGKTIVAISAKGGAGTSSLCANIAAAIANRTPTDTIVVVDLVLPLGSIAAITGYEGELNIVEISKKSTDDASILYFQQQLPLLTAWGFRLVAGVMDPEQTSTLNVANIPVIIDTLKRAFDYVIIDLGRSMSRISMPIIQSADQLLMVTGMGLASVDLTAKVWFYLRENGLKKEQLYPLINRTTGQESMSKRDVEELLDINITNAVPFTDANFALANNQNLPYMTKFPEDAATLSIIQAADEIRIRLKNPARALRGF